MCSKRLDVRQNCRAYRHIRLFLCSCADTCACDCAQTSRDVTAECLEFCAQHAAHIFRITLGAPKASSEFRTLAAEIFKITGTSRRAFSGSRTARPNGPVNCIRRRPSVFRITCGDTLTFSELGAVSPRWSPNQAALV